MTIHEQNQAKIEQIIQIAHRSDVTLAAMIEARRHLDEITAEGSSFYGKAGALQELVEAQGAFILVYIQMSRMLTDHKDSLLKQQGEIVAGMQTAFNDLLERVSHDPQT